MECNEIIFPCCVITTHPFRFDEDGVQIIEESNFILVETESGQAAIPVFTSLETMCEYMVSTGGVGRGLTLEVASQDQLCDLTNLLAARWGREICVVVDPDGPSIVSRDRRPNSPEEQAGNH